jgi:hypothetical protein
MRLIFAHWAITLETFMKIKEVFAQIFGLLTLFPRQKVTHKLWQKLG